MNDGEVGMVRTWSEDLTRTDLNNYHFGADNNKIAM